MNKPSKTRKKQNKRTKLRFRVNNSQLGGEKIGQGSFGCVLGPAIPCDNNPISKDYISKITYIPSGNENDYKMEMQILKKIHDIDPQQKYFISIVNECSLNMNKLNRNPKDTVNVSFDDEDLTDFTVNYTEPAYIQTMNTKDLTKKYCLIDKDYNPRNQIQVNGGTNLADILPTTHFNLYNSIRVNYKKIIIHLLNGLDLLHKNRIAHRDIKEFNILCKQSNTNPSVNVTKHNNINVRYIDFGLSDFVNPNIDDGGLRNFHYSGSPGYIPLEFVLLHYMNKYINYYGMSSIQNKSHKTYIINKVITNYTNNYKKFYAEIGIEKSLLKKSIKKPTRFSIISSAVKKPAFLEKPYLYELLDYFVDILKNKSFYKVLKADVNGLLYKGDVYALGITIAYLRKHYKLNNDKQLTDLVQNMIKLKHTERYNLQQCLSHPFCVA